jgi:predicted aspartyl protease
MSVIKRAQAGPVALVRRITPSARGLAFRAEQSRYYGHAAGHAQRHGRGVGPRGSVGLSYVQGTVRGPTGIAVDVRFLIDSGATYSLLPHGVWNAIALTPKREMGFALADGTTVRRAVSECHLSLPQGEGHTPVVLGEPGDAEALLGVVTLEILGLVFDLFRRTLHPMRALLV